MSNNKALAALESLGLHPQLLERYTAFLSSLADNDEVPQRVLELSNIRVAAIRGREVEPLDVAVFAALDAREIAAAQIGDGSEFAPAEAAVLSLAEKMAQGWHELSDDEVQAVTDHFGNAGCVTLMTAAAFFDVNYRLTAVLPGAATED